MSNYTACVDPEYIELIVKSVIQDMTNCHELQRGLKDCDDGWLGQDTAVVLCNKLNDMIQEAVDDGSLEINTGAPLKGDGSEDDPITLDEDKLKSLIASVFKNSEGNQLPEGTKLLSKEEVEEKLPKVLDSEGNKFSDDTQILSKEEVEGKLPKVLDSEGNKFSEDTKLLDKGQTEDAIDAVDPKLKDTEGNALPKGTKVKSAEESDSDIDDLKDDIEHQLECGLNNGIHTDASLAGDGTCDDDLGVDKDWLTDFIENETQAVEIVDCPVGDNTQAGNNSPMSETTGDELPTTIIGSKSQSNGYTREALMGKPDKLLKVKLPGDCDDATYYLPLYKA